MACRTWSLPDGQFFTGLCSMKMLAETDNPTGICNLCVTPMAPAEEDELYTISETCRTWRLPAFLLTPLCRMYFFPEEGVPSCPICVQPLEAE